MWQCAKCRERVEASFAVCWNCGTAQDGTEDADFRRADEMPTASLTAPVAEEPIHEEKPVPTSHEAHPCPLCGANAERGCVYGSDKGWSLRWHAGPPGFWSNVITGLGGGESVGGWGFGSGPYVEGIRCERCRRIILEY